MSNADAVAALPGGGEFAALWTQVNGDPGAIGDLAGTLQAAASRAQDSTKSVSKTAGEVGESWHGSAAHAFAGYMHRFSSAASTVHAAIDKAATTVQHAAASVSSAKEQLNSIASRILDAADRAAALKDDPDTESQYASAVRRAVSEGCAEAEPIVRSLVQDLEQAASAVHAAVSSQAFLAMTAANDHTYLPPPGKPIEWNPIPKNLDPGGATTAPASAGGGGGGSTGGASAPASSGGGTSSGAPGAMPTGDVAQWITEAKKVLMAHGVPASKISDADINMIIQHESSGNPHAQNNTDSNAAAGHPSKGLMQTIDSTFNSYALPGHTDVWNPVDNIIAGVRYALSRYGSLDSVPGVAAVHSGGSYVGY
jgi:WXG100 family type VII secretion target